MKNEGKILEKDLYTPLHNYFEKLGYEVHGEVKNCDITVSKGDELIIIEMKRSLNVELLIQAARRQNITEYVYAAIPRPNWGMRKWRDVRFFLQRLGVGLITVSFKKDAAFVDVVLSPSSPGSKKSPPKRKKAISAVTGEIEGRHGNFNLGGSTGVKLMTAYRENAIHIACCLKRYGSLSTRKLRELGTGEKTQSILHANYYGWFERVERGVYSLKEAGDDIFGKYPELTAHYEKFIEDKFKNP